MTYFKKGIFNKNTMSRNLICFART